MNLSPAWAGFLAGRGVAAVHWSDIGDPRAPDRDILAWARAHGHVVFTNDLDFSVLIALTGATGPSVLQVRALDLLPDAIGERVAELLVTCASEIASGAIVTLDGATTRVRVLPIGTRQGPA